MSFFLVTAILGWISKLQGVPEFTFIDISPDTCRHFQLSTDSSIDSLVSTSTRMGSFLMTKVKQFQSRPGHRCSCDSVFLPQIISYDYDFLCDSAHSGIFSGRRSCTCVSNTLIVFFRSLPIFLVITWGDWRYNHTFIMRAVSKHPLPYRIIQ